jgi:hypothetical protein
MDEGDSIGEYFTFFIPCLARLQRSGDGQARSVARFPKLAWAV